MTHEGNSPLTSDQRERAGQLALAALEHPADRRDDYVQAHCGDDRAVLAEVKNLLDHAQQVDEASFLDGPAELPPIETEMEPTDESTALGDQIGQYTLGEQLGEGGFATVFLAHQDEPVARDVAVKVLKPGMDSRQVVARFGAERQALALLDHPSIAKVLDAGTTDRYLPYFVMEYVPGPTMTEHCERHRLNIRQRLDVFLQVCHAVQYAHQKGIIHRDLKPSNILMSSDNQDAIPKVIDFGVAKALVGPLAGATLVTEQGQLIGTPEYMSPEQAALADTDVDTRSDVYALGVLLYELLTGALPLDRAELRKVSPNELYKYLSETDPAKPSSRLTLLTADDNGLNADQIASTRQSDTRSLIRHVRGDLDWIVMKALEKDRSRRYETVNALAMDVKRHLANEPVLASPPSTTYKMSRFVRRNRAAVTGASAAVAALAIGLGVATSQAVAASAAAERERRQATTRQEVVQFFVENIIASADPQRIGFEGQASLREAIDYCAERIDDQVEDPVAEASLRAAIGQMYLGLGLYDIARLHIESALATRRQILGDRDRDTLTSMNDWATWIQYAQEDFDQAEILFLEVLSLREQELGEFDDDTLASLNNLAYMYLDKGAFKEGYDEKAENFYQEALARTTKALGEQNAYAATIKGGLATLRQRAGDMDEAERLFRDSLATFLSLVPENDVNTVRTRNNLGFLLRQDERYEESEEQLAKALASAETAFGDHVYTYLIMDNLAAMLHKRFDEDSYKQADDLERAGPLYEEAVRGLRTKLPETDRDVIRTTHNLGTYYLRVGKYDDADALYSRLIEVAKSEFDESSWVMGVFRAAWGKALLNQGRFEDAQKLLLTAFDNLQAQVDRRAKCARSLEELYTAWNKAEDAARWKSTAEDLEQSGSK